MKPMYNRIIMYKGTYRKAWWDGRMYMHDAESQGAYLTECITLAAKILDVEEK